MQKLNLKRPCLYGHQQDYESTHKALKVEEKASNPRGNYYDPETNPMRGINSYQIQSQVTTETSLDTTLERPQDTSHEILCLNEGPLGDTDHYFPTGPSVIPRNVRHVLPTYENKLDLNTSDITQNEVASSEVSGSLVLDSNLRQAETNNNLNFTENLQVIVMSSENGSHSSGT